MGGNKPDALILLIDDEAKNLKLLTALLAERDYEVLTSLDGVRGLEAAREAQPDLILLDIRMPGMDGFTVCRRLREDEACRDIPVIFTSVHDELENKVEGFRAGAVDYVTKPFQAEEVLARVDRHLELARLRGLLARRNEELKAFSSTVAHSLRNPIGAMRGIIEQIQVLTQDPESLIRQLPQMLQILSQGSSQALGTVDALLMLARVSDDQPPPLSNLAMVPILDKVCKEFQQQADRLGATLIRTQPTCPMVRGHEEWLAEIWRNLISNALKYTGPEPQIEIGWRIPEPTEGSREDPQIEFWVADQGPGLSEQECQWLFQPFSRLHPHLSEGHGLGLSIVERIVTRLGGEVGMETKPGSGSRFWFRLPGGGECWVLSTGC
jgi:signal transduction histidine kinase